MVAYKCDNVKETLWSFWWLHFGFSAHSWVVGITSHGNPSVSHFKRRFYRCSIIQMRFFTDNHSMGKFISFSSSWKDVIYFTLSLLQHNTMVKFSANITKDLKFVTTPKELLSLIWSLMLT